MTIGIGVMTGDGVVIGCDTMQWGSGKSFHINKIKKFGKVRCIFAGSAGVIEQFTRSVRDEHEKMEDFEYFIDRLISFNKSEDISEEDSMCGIWTDGTDLIDFDDCGGFGVCSRKCLLDSFIATGSGRASALGYLFSKYQQDCLSSTATEIVKGGVLCASMFDPFCGEEAIVEFVPKR